MLSWLRRRYLGVFRTEGLPSLYGAHGGVADIEVEAARVAEEVSLNLNHIGGRDRIEPVAVNDRRERGVRVVVR